MDNLKDSLECLWNAYNTPKEWDAKRDFFRELVGAIDFIMEKTFIVEEGQDGESCWHWKKSLKELYETKATKKA